MKVSQIGFVKNNSISYLQNRPKKTILQSQTYQQIQNFYGRDLVNSSKNTMLPLEISTRIPKGCSIQELISLAQSEENRIGQGANSTVYNIPYLDDYVLKVLNKDDPNKINMQEFPSHINLGQPVWQDGENPRNLILKKISGAEHSIQNWSELIKHATPVTTAQAKQFAKQFTTISQMTQKAFDDLAVDVKLLDDKGYKLDSINPNNLIVDSENNQMHIIDYFKVKPREAHLYQNSCFDLVAVISDFTLFPEYFDKMNDTEKQSTLEALKTITDKMYKGCEKAGLSCDDEKYITYINTTAKWFPIDAVKKENGEEYVRAYEIRMQDFIKMVYNPEQWASKRNEKVGV